MIFDDIDESLLSYTIEKYGAEHQIIVAIEELSELIKELCKNRRGQDNKAAIIEEMADCCIMLEQLQLIFGVSNRTLRKAAIDKLDRLVDTLSEEVEQ